MAFGHTTWQRLPCPPANVRVLEASYNTKRGFVAWDDGGRITSGLYQTLDSVVRCGPGFGGRYRLQHRIHLEELKIKVESREGTSRVCDDDYYIFSDRETNPETTLYALGSIVDQIVNTGVLRGYVDMISVCSTDKTLSWIPREVAGNGRAKYWNRYGFGWREKALQ